MGKRNGPVDPNADEREEMVYYYKTHPTARDKANPKQYSYPIGPEHPRSGANPNQYKQPIGPRQADPNQYSTPIGPKHPHAGADAHQYRHPIGPTIEERDAYYRGLEAKHGPMGTNRNPNTYDRIRNAAKDAYDTGARIESARREAGRGSTIGAINSGSGFSNQSPRQQPRRNTQLPDENPNNNERIYLTICDSQGNCRQKTIKGAPKKPRQRRGPGWGVGGLGSFGDDTGFL